MKKPKNDWVNGYIYGPYDVLKKFLINSYPDKESGKGYTLPGNIAFKAGYNVKLKQGKDAIDEDGKKHKTYTPDTACKDVLVLVSARAEGLAIYDKLAKLKGVKVHKQETVQGITKLYPNHCKNGVPHIS